MSVDNMNDKQNIEQLEAQAKKIASLLDNHAQRLSMRTIKQIEDGRARAVSAHHKTTSMNADGTLNHWASWIEQHRLAFAGLLMATIIGGFVMMQTYKANQTSDAFLLGADLPPEAFVDRGFEPALNRQVRI